MISPLAYVDPAAKLGRNVTVHPFAFIDADTEIGDDCEIMPYASIIRGTRMGSRNKVYQGSVIGADPQDFRWKGDQTYCYIGDNNVIREHVIINRGIKAEGGTNIGSECFIMANSHIGHDSVLKGKCVIGNNVAVAGDAVIGECVILSSGAIVHEKCHIGEWVLVKGGCRIGSNVPPFVIVAHNPVEFFGINAVVMKKGGMTDEDIDSAAKSYRHLYQSQTSVFNALKRIQADIDECEIKHKIMDFIKSVNNRLVAIPRELSV